MHGKENLQRAVHRDKRAQSRTKTQKKSYLEIGNWRFEENEDGDLIVTNLETQTTTILIEK